MKVWGSLCLAILPSATLAEIALTDLVGSWAGQGSYYETLSKAKMRCRLEVQGNALSVHITGRCASTMGAEDIDMRVSNTASGAWILTSTHPEASAPGAPAELTGKPVGNQVMLEGQTDTDTVRVQFAKNAKGTIFFATEHETASNRDWSKITLTRR